MSRKGLGGFIEVQAVSREHENMADVAKAFLDIRQSAIVKQVAPIDDDEALAKVLDVLHVVGGEDDGRVAIAVDLTDGFGDLFFDQDIEANRRLVEEEDFGVMNEGGGQIGPHPLSEREGFHLREHEGFETEQTVEIIKSLLIFILGDAIDVPIKVEGIA